MALGSKLEVGIGELEGSVYRHKKRKLRVEELVCCSLVTHNFQCHHLIKYFAIWWLGPYDSTSTLTTRIMLGGTKNSSLSQDFWVTSGHRLERHSIERGRGVTGGVGRVERVERVWGVERMEEWRECGECRKWREGRVSVEGESVGSGCGGRECRKWESGESVGSRCGGEG